MSYYKKYRSNSYGASKWGDFKYYECSKECDCDKCRKHDHDDKKDKCKDKKHDDDKYYYEDKYSKKCDCDKCRKHDHDDKKDKRKDKKYDDDDKYYYEDKYSKKCDCDKCRKHDNDDKKDKGKDKKHYEKYYRSNEWIQDMLEDLVGVRVVIFTKDGTHTEGTVKEVSNKFVTIVATNRRTYPYGELVEVESNANGSGLELFLTFFIRLDDIVGFGEETVGDPAE